MTSHRIRSGRSRRARSTPCRPFSAAERLELLEAEDGEQVAPHLGFVFDDQDLLHGEGNNGRRTVKVVPRPNVLSTVISPPCSSTQRFTITRPRPVPGRSPTFRPRWKARKSHSRSSAGMPMPWSRNWQTASVPSRRTANSTGLPGGEYLTALASRLVKMWRSRRSSASAAVASSARSSRIGQACLGRDGHFLDHAAAERGQVERRWLEVHAARLQSGRAAAPPPSARPSAACWPGWSRGVPGARRGASWSR